MLLWPLNWVTIFGQISFGHVLLTFFGHFVFCHSLTFWPCKLAPFVHFVATFCHFGLVIWPCSCIFWPCFLLTAFFHSGHIIQPCSYILAMLVLATFFHFGHVIWPRLCIFGHVTFGHSLFEFPRLVSALCWPCFHPIPGSLLFFCISFLCFTFCLSPHSDSPPRTLSADLRYTRVGSL